MVVDVQLLKAAATGDPEQLLNLVQAAGPHVRLAIAAHLHSAAAVMEVESQVWKNISTHLATFQGDHDANEWLLQQAVEPVRQNLLKADEQFVTEQNLLMHQFILQSLDALQSGAEMTVLSVPERLAQSDKTHRDLIEKRYKNNQDINDLAATFPGGINAASKALMSARAAIDWTGIAQAPAAGEMLLPSLIEDWIADHIDNASCALLEQKITKDSQRAEQFYRQVRLHVVLASYYSEFKIQEILPELHATITKNTHTSPSAANRTASERLRPVPSAGSARSAVPTAVSSSSPMHTPASTPAPATVTVNPRTRTPLSPPIRTTSSVTIANKPPRSAVHRVVPPNKTEPYEKKKKSLIPFIIAAACIVIAIIGIIAMSANTGTPPKSPTSSTSESLATQTTKSNKSADIKIDAGTDRTVTIGAGNPWNPSQLKAAAWYDASDENSISTNGGTIKQWKDKSGHNRHASQNYQPSQAKLQGNYLEFDGENDFYTADPITSIPLTVIGVLRTYTDNEVTDGSKSWLMQHGDAPNPDFYLSAPTNVDVMKASFLQTTGKSYSEAAKAERDKDHLYAMSAYVAGKDPGFLRIDGGADSVQLKPGDPLQKAGKSKLYIGTQKGKFRTRFFKGRIYEIIILDRRLTESDDELLKTEGYLAHKWNLSGILPSTHSYKKWTPGNAAVTVTLNGDIKGADTNTVQTTWKLATNTSVVDIENPNKLNPTVTITEPGSYTFQLIATGDFGTVSDDVVITVVR